MQSKKLTKMFVAFASTIAITGCVWTLATTANAASKREKVVTDWTTYGGQPANDHYSALNQINKSNVAQLKVAWTYDTDEDGVMATNPLVAGNVLYAFTPTQKVIALDAATGKLLWKFDSGVPSTQPTRGLSYWTDGNQARLFAGVMNYLYALDPKTGKPIPDFGEAGRIDLRKGLRGDYRLASIALTTPGLVYKDLIIVGGEMPETLPAQPGDIRAYRCSYRRPPVELPHNSTPWRVRIRNVAGRCLAAVGFRQQLGWNDSRCRARDRLRSDRVGGV